MSGRGLGLLVSLLVASAAWAQPEPVEPTPTEEPPVEAKATSGDEATPEEDEVAPGEDEVAPGEDETTPEEDEVAPEEGEPSPEGDEPSPEGDEPSPEGDEESDLFQAGGAGFTRTTEKGLELGFRVRPLVSIGLHTPRTAPQPVRTNLVLGLNGVFTYEKRRTIGYWGSAYGSFQGMLGSKRSGWEIRGGATFGPSFGIGRAAGRVSFVAYSGAELLVDRYRHYCRPYGTTFQLGIPLMARVQLSVIWAEAGVMPSWFLSAPNRDRVDWTVSDVAGFGDEFEIRGAAGVVIDRFRLGLWVRSRVASYGDQTWFGLGLGYFGGANTEG